MLPQKQIRTHNSLRDSFTFMALLNLKGLIEIASTSESKSGLFAAHIIQETFIIAFARNWQKS